ncbi:MAG: SDR family oxidoreductase [Acidobacteria bacterium]|nr:SDR family oxidoreductase [Acidobacteriota bacterium]
MRKVLVTGGGGYVGAVLVPALLAAGYAVTVVDLFIYGDDVLDPHPALRCVTGDIRDADMLRRELVGVTDVIHLACISNDPSFELNPDLGRSINLDAFEPLVAASRDAGASRFIYASSSSVYGIKEVPDVTEDMPLEPLTDYSRFKAQCEEILARYQSPSFTTVTIRPATVCGYSRRQRLDVVVNILTNQAYHNREVTILGGDQLRPNIHIADMVDAYLLLLAAEPDTIAGRIYNAGYENQSVRAIADEVRSVIGDDVRVVRKESNDNRSYHISSARILDELGFRATRTIADAVRDLKDAFDAGLLPASFTDERYFNIKRMQSIELQ